MKVRCEWVSETREDKYGQNIRLVCDCGIFTNWHTSKDRAVIALKQNHEMKGITT